MPSNYKGSRISGYGDRSQPPSRRVRRLLGVIRFPFLVGFFNALAAVGQAEVASPEADSEIDEVVVTATRRAESISNISASISAVGSEALGASGVKNVADLAELVPDLSVGNQFGINRAFIRGIGLTSIDLGGDGAVAYLQDSAQIARPSEQLSGFYDIDRVEVLRGPQGTLYGRGATAGVINILPKKPTDDVDGYADLTLGNYAQKDFEGALGGPLSETLSARVATNIERRAGYGTNLFTGTQVDDRAAESVRASFRFKAQSNLLADLVIDYIHENDDDFAFHYLGPTITTNSGLPAVALFGGTTLFNCCGTNMPDLRNIWSSVDPTNKRHGIGVTGIVEWSNPGYDLKSTTAYRTFSRFDQDDLAVSNAELYGRNLYDESSQTYSQDLTLSAGSGRAEWLSGINFFHEHLYGSVRVPTFGLGVTLTGGQCLPRDPTATVPCDFEDNGNYWQLGTVTTNAYGAFAQGAFSLATNLTLTAGMRFSREERSGQGRFIFDAIGANVPTDRSASWNAVTPKLSLEYHLAPTALIYSSINRGFKSGVINVGSTNPVINPEYVYAYETGFKAKELNERLLLTAAAFFYDYKNLQVGFVNAQSVVSTVNAAAARIYGLETEVIAKPAPRLEVSFSGTYLDAKYTSFETGDYRNGFALTNVAGNYLDNSPPYTLRIGLDYRMPLPGKWGGLRFKAEDFYQGRVYFTEFNNSDATQGAYGLVNGAVDWESLYGHWTVTAWIRNAADKLAIANNIITAPLYSSVRVGSIIAPRTLGATIGYRF